MSLSTLSLMDPDPEILWEDTGSKTIAFFCKRHPVCVDTALLEELKKISEARGGKNVRLCLHDSPDADHHDMVILEHKGKYYRPHKHLEKGEAFHIMVGRMGVFTFDDAGNVTESRALGSGEILRVGINMYHAVMPLTDLVIYHENKPGPFLGDKDSIFPDWAPDGIDIEKAAAYSAELANLL
jgi:cupin fold WbuC family metalloprotein